MREAFPKMWIGKQADGADPWKAEGKAILRTDLDPISIRGAAIVHPASGDPVSEEEVAHESSIEQSCKQG